MKRYILSALAFFTIPAAFAQQFRGEAVYQTKQILHMRSHDEYGNVNEYVEKLKKAYEKEYILYFDKTTSLYIEQPKLEEPVPGQPVISSDIPIFSKHYKNIKDKTYVKERDFLGKLFLEVDSLQKYSWKLENDTKKIGNYTCYKATCIIPKELKEPKDEKPINILSDKEEKDDVIVAWYTPEIPVSNGPDGYWGLPGLIMEVSGLDKMMLCSKITLNPKERIEIVSPKKGEKVTADELEQIAIKKKQEMND